MYVHGILSDQMGLKDPMGHLEFEYSTLHLSCLHLNAFTVLLLEVAALWEEPPLHGCILICLLKPSQPSEYDVEISHARLQDLPTIKMHLQPPKVCCACTAILRC